MNQSEGLSAIRILGAVARADGNITDDERAAFRAAVSELAPTLPAGATVESLLADASDLDRDLEAVTSPLVRRAVFEMAFAISTIDGTTDEENRVLARIRSAFAYAKESNVLDKALEATVARPHVAPLLDTKERSERVGNLIGERAIYAGVLGAIPIPLVSDIGVFYQINAVVDEISVVWGHPLTMKEKFARFGTIVSVALLQTAVHSLLKMIPGWGSVAGAVGGGIGSFAVVGAIGKVVDYHFQKEEKTTASELREVFKSAQTEGKARYEGEKGTIDALRVAHENDIAALGKRLENEELTKAEYEANVEALLRAR